MSESILLESEDGATRVEGVLGTIDIRVKPALDLVSLQSSGGRSDEAVRRVDAALHTWMMPAASRYPCVDTPKRECYI